MLCAKIVREEFYCLGGGRRGPEIINQKSEIGNQKSEKYQYVKNSSWRTQKYITINKSSVSAQK